MMVFPAQRCQLPPRLSHDLGTTLDARQPAATFRYAVPAGVARLPGTPEARLVAGTVAGVTEPVQLHAPGLEIAYRRGVPWLTAQQPGGGESEALAGRGQGMQVVGMGATQAQ